MKNKKNNLVVVKVGCGLLAGILAPSVVHACACGCGVFDVGGSSMIPNGQGGMAFLQYDYQDQNRNWSGFSQAPAANNGDKEIETHFITTGVQYMFNNNWGFKVEVPYDYRTFKTVTGNPNVPPGTVATVNWGALGDIRLEGIYTGFFADKSAGVTFGLKIPTGDYTYNNAYGDVDRDSEIGTGSTDILLGGFYRGNITKDENWDWFAQFLLDVPTLTQAGYRPGVELDSAAGIDYKGFSVGRARISPLAQVIVSERTSDSGSNASGGSNDDPADGVSSGYQRVMLSPGIEFHIHPVKIYADAEFPVLQHFTGNQMAAPVLFKFSVSYMF
ncbi:MAG: hypothetical protein ABSG87_00165 [Verrucomicrobiota bacterium]